MKVKVKDQSVAIKSLSKDIKEALARLKYRWEVEHVRPVHNFVMIKKVDDEHVEYDNCLSRDEFNDAVENLQYIAPAEMPKIYGCFVCTVGGFTRVSIIKKDGSVLVGKHNFRPKDNFFKNLGFIKAVYKITGKEIQPVIDQIIEERRLAVEEFNRLNKD